MKKKALLIFFRCFFGILSLVLLYALAAFVLSVIPVNIETLSEEESSVDIYFISNGVHFDILVPIRNEHKDWAEEELLEFNTDLNYMFVGFGWGDKGFYLNK